MKHEKLLTPVCAWSISALLGVAAMGCIASGFEIELAATSISIVLLFAAAFCLCSAIPHGRLIGCAAAALVLGLFWNRSGLALQFEALVHHISTHYNNAYGWGVVHWSGSSLSGVPMDGALAALGCLVALITGKTVWDGRHGILAIVSVVTPLAVCVVVTDTIPSNFYLFLLLFGLAILLMTHSLRKKNSAEGNRLTVIIAIPLALALGLLFWLIPRDGYTPPPEDLTGRVISWFDDMQSSSDIGEQLMQAFTGISEDTVNLRSVGPKNRSRYTVMEVSGSKAGPLYLRGEAFDTYDGKSWTKSQGTWQADDAYISSGNIVNIHIVTRSVHDVLYIPYNPDSVLLEGMEQGRIPNDEKLKDYYVSQSQPVNFTPAQFIMTSYHVTVVHIPQYLQLPEDTKADALRYLQAGLDDYLAEYTKDYPFMPKITVTDSGVSSSTGKDALYCYSVAHAIADMVRDSATYHLRTRRMPSDHPDFAMWFLNESDTGYCVHFATATTVLLRAAGIPARYVTGYLADGAENQTVDVLASDGHAWVEYLLPGYGWQVLEATPAAPDSPVVTAPAETESQPVETIAPPSTQPVEPPDPTSPQATAPSEAPADTRPAPDLSGLWKILSWLATVGLAAAVILGQRLVRLRWRNERCHRAEPNRRGLLYWQETELLCRLLKQEPPPLLLELAQKAKFSQHQLSPEELQHFINFRDEAIGQLRSGRWYMQVICRLVLALY